MALGSRYLHSGNQMRRLDADQPLENSTAQQCPAIPDIPDILELLAISGISDVGEVPKEAVRIVAAQQLTICGYVDL